MTKYTLEQLKQARLTWPNEVREQLDDDILDYIINDDRCDWPTLTWKKVDLHLTGLLKFTQSATVSAMTITSRLGFSYGVENDLERHQSLREYLLENGTWPKAPAIVLSSSGHIIVDGYHRFVQLIDINNLLQMAMNLEPTRQQILYDEFQNHNYVKQLNNTHEIWLGESKIN